MAESVRIKILGDATGLTKALGVAESGLGKLGGAVSTLGNLAKAGMAAAGVAAAASFVNGFGDAMDRQALRAVVGDDILESSAAIYRNAWGESLEEVATLMAETERAFGEGADLEGLTEAAFIVSQKFGGDVNTAMQTAAELAESFGVTGEHAFDLIAAASGEMSAEVRDELGSAIKEYGGVFDDLGLSSETMMRLFTDFGEGGAIQLDKVGDAFKELSIRSTDGSDATADAFAIMGRDMELYQQLMFEGGDAAADATFGIIRALKEIEDPAAQAEAAIALFGAPLEDLGATAVPEFLDKLQGMGGGFKDVTGLTAAMGEELGDNLMTRLTSLKRNGLDKIAATIEKHVIPAAEKLLDTWEEVWPAIEKTARKVIGYLVDTAAPLFQAYISVWMGGATMIWDKFREVWPAIRDTVVGAVTQIQERFDYYWPLIRGLILDTVETVRAKFAEVWPVIQATVVDAVMAIVVMIQDNWPAIRDTVVNTVEAIWDVIKRVWPVIQNVVTAVVTDLVALMRKHWPQIREIVETAITGVWAVIERVTIIITDLWERWGQHITDYIVAAWALIQEAVGAALDIIQGLFQTFKALFEGDWSAMWDGIVLTFSGIWELLKTAIAYLWEEARLATALALDLIKTEVWDMVQAIPGLLLEAGDLLWSTGKVLFAFLGRGIMVAMEAASVALWEWLKGVPASLWDLGVKLKDTGRELFEEMGKGILAALISIPGLITQHVLVPLLSIESKINQIIALANSPALSAAMIVQQTFQPDNSGRNDTSTTGGVTFSAGTQSLLNARGAAGEGPLGLGGPVNINVTTQDPFLAAQIVVSELQMIGPR
jgi:phage-related minor tail protein